MMVRLARYVRGAHCLIPALALLLLIPLLNISSSTLPAQAADLSPNPSSRVQADTRVLVRQNVTWNGGGDSRWSNPANWEGGIVPGPFDIVNLTGSADTEIDVAFSEAVAGIVLAADFGGTVHLAHDLQVRGDVVIEGGAFVQGDHALTTVGWMQTNGRFVGGSAPLTITEAATVRGGVLVTPSAAMRVRSLALHSPGVVRLGANGKLELAGDGTPLIGDGVLDTSTNLPNSVESTGRATTDLLAAGPLRSEAPAPVSMPGAAPASALTLAAGEDNLRAAVIDATGAFAYFGTSTNPGIVVKVRLADFTRVGALRLASGENDLHTAVVDPANGFAYFATYTSPGIIVKVRLSDFTRAGALKLNAGENLPRGAVIDPAKGFAYFGTFTSPGKIIQVRLSDLTRVRALTLNSGDDLLFAAVIDPAAGFAYFGGRTVPGFIVKIRLSDLTRVARLTMNSGEDSFHTGVIDPTSGFAYFGSYTPTGIVVKVRLSDFTKVDTLRLNSGEGNLRSSVIDRANGFVYFGTADTPGIVITVRLSDFTRVGARILDPGQDKLRSVVIDPANRFMYFGTGSSPGIVIKLPTVSDSSTPIPTATNTPIKTATPAGTPGSVTLNPVADAFVNSANLSTNYGAANQLRVDGSPIVRSYLRFEVTGLSGPVTKATLRLYARSSQSTGYSVYRVSDNTWSETSLTYGNAPALGSLIGSSGAVTDGTWTSADVTPFITGNGAWSLALATSSSATLSLASRETSNKPQLVITTGSGRATATLAPTATTGAGATPTRTRTPTSTSASPANTATRTATRTRTPTPANTPGTIAFVPVADSYVEAANPSTSYGTLSQIRIDGSPVANGYIRFNVTGLAGNVATATLRLYANSSLSTGGQARGVASNNWSETTINYSNAPAPSGSVTGTTGAFSAGAWSSVDITPLITGNGTFSIAVTTTGSTAVGLGSRESGSHAPQLVITTK